MKAILVFLIIMSSLYSSVNISNKKIIVGIRAWKGIDLANKEWTSTINYLSENIDGYTFELKPLVDYETIKEKIKNKEIDFLFSDPVLYIESEYNFGITRLATLQRKSKGLYFDKFGSVIFTSSKNKHLQSLTDIKNMIFMGVSENALAGYRMAYRELLKENISVNTFFKKIEFSNGRGDLVVKKVLNNKNYVGTVRTGLLENMIKRGVIKKEDIHIVNKIEYEYFPFLASSSLYPEFPFSKLAHISDELSKKVLLALLSIKEDSQAAKDGKYARWLIPSEYTDIVELMKELNIGIYKDLNSSITFSKVIEKYKIELLIVCLFIMSLLVLLLILKRQSIVIEEEKVKLEQLLENEKIYKNYLEIQKNEFESIFNYSHDGIAIIDLDTNFLEFNDSFMALTGYSKEELLLKSCRELTSPEYLEENEQAIQEAIENGYSNNFEKECIVNNDKKINVNISVSLLPDKKRLLLTLKDVSSLKILESQSRLASMGEMIGNIAHQWRQPLSVITTSASGLQIYSEMDNLNKDNLKKSLDSIIKQSNYLSSTIDNFSGFIKGTNTKSEVSLRQIIKETISIVDASLSSNYIKLIVDLEQDSNVFVNKNEIIESLVNIINNAKDILKEKIEKESDRFIFIKLENVDKDIIKLSIQDTGGGIPEKIIERVFEPYFSTKHQSLGTGLGLSISDKILRERHKTVLEVNNKTINYDNKIYTGACFSILFNNY